MTRWLLSLLFALTLALPARAQIDPSDLPPVDSVIVPSAQAVSPERIEIRWKIAPGYYLYRHRFAAQALGEGVTSAKFELPDGTPHRDEFFGDVQTYRGSVTGVLPISVASADTVAVRIKYQGCADVGFCYPPQTRTLNVRLPAATGNDGDSGFKALAGALGQPAGGIALGGGKTAPLPEQQAFKVEVIADGGQRLMARLTPAPGYYLYRDKIHLRLEDANGARLGKPVMPAGKPHRDEHFGHVQVFFDQVELTAPVQRTAGGALPVRVRVDLQGCQDNGICYEPMRRSFALTLPPSDATTQHVAKPDAVPPATTPTAEEAASTVGETTSPVPTPDNSAAPANEATTPHPEAASPTLAAKKTTASTGLLPALLLALLGGLILNLMPCVLPVLSLKALSLAQSGESRAKAKRHALLYTAGVLTSFALLGAIILAVRGDAAHAVGWGFQLQYPRVVAVLALVMLALGLSLSGLWFAQFALPQAGQRMAQGGGARGDFLTGVLAVVLATPCTAPFMGAALAYAFNAPAVGAMLVFLVMGLGLALPFLLIGFVPGLARWLPKPGAWMETFKQLLAFPMYATAAWLVWVLVAQRGADAFGLWAVGAIGLALALWAWTRARIAGAKWAYAFVLLGALLVGWAMWRVGQLPRASAVPPPASSTEEGHVAYSAARLQQLRGEGRVVFVNITADWCVTCKVNERAVFARPDFAAALGEVGGTYMVGDHTDVDPAISEFLKQHGAVGLPLYVVYPAKGGEGEILPTLLTPQLVRDALLRAKR